jgi:hypothetical protein
VCSNQCSHWTPLEPPAAGAGSDRTFYQPWQCPSLETAAAGFARQLQQARYRKLAVCGAGGVVVVARAAGKVLEAHSCLGLLNSLCSCSHLICPLQWGHVSGCAPNDVCHVPIPCMCVAQHGQWAMLPPSCCCCACPCLLTCLYVCACCMRLLSCVEWPHMLVSGKCKKSDEVVAERRS